MRWICGYFGRTGEKERMEGDNDGKESGVVRDGRVLDGVRMSCSQCGGVTCFSGEAIEKTERLG